MLLLLVLLVVFWAALPTPVTASTNSVLFYRTISVGTGLSVFKGEMTRAGTTAMCIQQAQYTSLGCVAAFAVVAFPTEGVSYSNPFNFATGVPFSATAPVRGPTGTLIADNWTALWTGSLHVSLQTAGVATGITAFWTGLNSDGTNSAQQCGGWTGEGGSGQVGDTTSTTSTWVSATTSSCANANSILCACLPSALVTPTPPPTNRIVLYSGFQYSSANIGTRAQTTAACKSYALFRYLSCSSETFPLLGYSTDAVNNYTLNSNPATGVTFSASAPVVGVTGVQIAKNWVALWDGTAESNSLFAAGVYSGYTTSSKLYFTGITQTGVRAATNCADWSSSSSGVTGAAGDPTLGAAGWMTAPTSPKTCSAGQLQMCVCLPIMPTSSPSRAPSISPTTSIPSRSPTTSVPSRTPTTSMPSHSPSVSPTSSRPSRAPSTATPSGHPSRTPTGSPTTANAQVTRAVGSVAFVGGVAFSLLFLML